MKRACLEKGRARISQGGGGGEFRNFRATYMIIPRVIPCVSVSPCSCGDEDQQVDYKVGIHVCHTDSSDLCVFKNLK